MRNYSLVAARVWVGVMAAACACCSYRAGAAVESFTIPDTPSQADSHVREVEIPQFNPSLGSLQSITLDVRGVGVFMQGFDHPSGTDRRLSGLTDFALVLTSSDNPGLITLGHARPGSFQTPGSLQSGFRFQQNPGSGGFQRAVAAGQETLTSSSDLARFTGCGLVDLFLSVHDRFGLDLDGTRNALSGLWNVGADVKVTYDYTPVPEAAPWKAGAIAVPLLALLLNRGWRRARPELP